MQTRRLKSLAPSMVTALTLALAGSTPTSLSGQATPAPRPAPRRTVATLTVTSPSFADGAEMPVRHTQAGGDHSPALAWSKAPDSTVSFVVVVTDLDALAPGTADPLLHWLVWNIPAPVDGLEGDLPRVSENSSGLRQISVSGPYYRGPAAPATGPPHHYVFDVFALDTKLNIPAVGSSPQATRSAVIGAMVGHVLAKGTLVVRYRRP